MSSGETMTFARFMELCLYEPETGYYRRGAKVFGPRGDFYTSPTCLLVSVALTLAYWLIQWFRR